MIGKEQLFIDVWETDTPSGEEHPVVHAAVVLNGVVVATGSCGFHPATDPEGKAVGVAWRAFEGDVLPANIVRR